MISIALGDKSYTIAQEWELSSGREHEYTLILVNTKTLCRNTGRAYCLRHLLVSSRKLLQICRLEIMWCYFHEPRWLDFHNLSKHVISQLRGIKMEERRLTACTTSKSWQVRSRERSLQAVGIGRDSRRGEYARCDWFWAFDRNRHSFVVEPKVWLLAPTD